MKLKLAGDLKLLLTQVSELVDQYEDKSLRFIDSLKKWLRDAEDVLKKHQKPKSAELAGIRASITAAQNGVFLQDFDIKPNITRRTKLLSYTALQMKQAQSFIQEIVDPIDSMRESALGLLKATLVKANGLIAVHIQQYGSLDANVVLLWSSLVADPELAPETRQLLSIFSFPECLLLLEETVRCWTAELEEVRRTNGFGASQKESEISTEPESEGQETSAAPETTEEAQPEPPKIVIAAALINPKGTDFGNETVLLWNQGEKGINLKGWIIQDQSERKTDLEGLSVPPNSQLTVPLDGGAKLNNTGGEISLIDQDGKVIHQVTYTRSDVKEGENTVFVS